MQVQLVSRMVDLICCQARVTASFRRACHTIWGYRRFLRPTVWFDHDEMAGFAVVAVHANQSKRTGEMPVSH